MSSLVFFHLFVPLILHLLIDKLGGTIMQPASENVLITSSGIKNSLKNTNRFKHLLNTFGMVLMPRQHVLTSKYPKPS